MNINERSDRLAKEGAAQAAGSASVGDQPLYLQIVQALRREITAGVYPVGTVLPSESLLCDRFGVSRHTVREALRALREAGLVTSRKGLGTIVQGPDRGFGYVHRVNSISDLFPTGVETTYDLGKGGLVPLPDTLGNSAQTGEARWLRIGATRRQPGHDLPFNELESFVAARFAGVGRALGAHPGPIYGLIEALYGETVGEVEQVIGTFRCDGTKGAALGMEVGDIGIQIRRIYRVLPSGEVAQVSFNRYLPEEFSFSMTLRRVRD